MGKIFYLMGRSSSGKDTIYKELLSRKHIDFHKIVLYTTRPARTGEVDGVQYHFVSEAEADELVKSGKVIELRSYDTYYGIWKYFTVDDGQIDLANNNYLIIGTLESFLKTKQYYGVDKVIPIMIELDDGVRLQRALDRERAQSQPHYEEMCRRFLADAVDFSGEKLSDAGIEKQFYNHDLETCLQEIESFVIENM